MQPLSLTQRFRQSLFDLPLIMAAIELQSLGCPNTSGEIIVLIRRELNEFSLRLTYPAPLLCVLGFHPRHLSSVHFGVEILSDSWLWEALWNWLSNSLDTFSPYYNYILSHVTFQTFLV